MNVVSQTFVQLSLAPKELLNRADECRKAHEYLQKVWDACTTMGLTKPKTTIELTTSFPDADDISLGNSKFTVRAAKLDPKQVDLESEAFVFEYQDVLGVLVELKAADNESPNFWSEMFSTWRKTVTQHLGNESLPSGMLGESYVFRGFIADDNPDPGNVHDTAILDLSMMSVDNVFAEEAHIPASKGIAPSISTLLPNNITMWNAPAAYLTKKGFCLLEGDAINDRRVIAALAPVAQKAAANTWMVWGGVSQAAPFIRYLVHTSKVRFAERVFERELKELRSMRTEVDRRLDEFFRNYLDIIDKKKIVSQSVLAQLHTEMVPRKIDKYDLIKGTSRLKELLVTVQTAQKNIEPLIPDPETSTSSNSLFDREKRTMNWLLDQLPVEIEYMEATKERIEEGHQLLEMRLDEESQGISHRLSELILYQGSVLGSLVVALTAVQSFGLSLPLPNDVQWGIALLLMGIALSLPPLFTHWNDRYNKADYVIGGVLVASFFNFLATLGAHVGGVTVSILVWVLYRLLVILAGFVLGYRGVAILVRRRMGGKAEKTG